MHVFTNWVPATPCLATGVIGLFLIQSSFHAGPITSSQAALHHRSTRSCQRRHRASDLFHDRLETAGSRLPVEFVAIVVVVAGLLLLSTSPLVAGAKDESGKAATNWSAGRRQGLAPGSAHRSPPDCDAHGRSSTVRVEEPVPPRPVGVRTEARSQDGREDPLAAEDQLVGHLRPEDQPQRRRPARPAPSAGAARPRGPWPARRRWPAWGRWR